MDLKQFGELNYLSINNLRAIELVEMKLEGKNFVPLYGPNGSGKSTVLDALMMLFKGGAIPDQIIKDGGKLATIKAGTTTGIKIEKRIKLKKNGEQTSELVMSSENKLISSPQKILKELFGSFITPNKIAESTGIAIYKSIVENLGITFEDTEKEIEIIKNQISDENAVIRVNPEITMPERGKPDSLEYSREDHIVAEKIKANITNHEIIVKTTVKVIADLEEELEELKLKVEAAKIKLVQQQNSLLKEKEDAGDIDKKLADFENAVNNQTVIAEWKTFSARDSLLSTAKTKLVKFKQDLIKYEKSLANKISSTDTGVSGLTLAADKSVLFNGLPWENTCFSDKMKVAATLGIKNNPKNKLPIMFIEHGESLSDVKRQEIAKEAINQGAIVFIEVFMENTEGIEDGVVLSLPEKHYIPTEAKESETSQLEIFPQTQEPIEIEIVKTKEEKEDILKTLGLTKVNDIKTGDELWD